MIRTGWIAAALLALAGCGDGGAPEAEAPVENAATEAPAEQASLPDCPFRETGDWTGSIEGGRLLITGTVDLQMAGFRPALTERESSGGVVALDLALAPEPQAAVTDQARYERNGAAPARFGEIWCGGKRIARFDIIQVG